MKTKLKYLFTVLLLLACTSKQEEDEIPANLFPFPESVEANPHGGYTINPITGDSIQPLVNSLGDTIETGVPISATGKIINPNSVSSPQIFSIPNLDRISTANAHPNVYKIPDKLTKIWVNTDSLTQIPLEKITKNDTAHYIRNSIGDTVKTGVPIPVKGKKVETIQPQSIPALPPRINNTAINNLQYIDVDQGIASSYIWCILNDKNGNLWFGTNGYGVSMYNGESFTLFTEEEGLSSNYVLSILEDKNGNLWFATNGGGVSMYDGHSFTHFTVREGLSSNYILSIFEDRNGNLWFGTNGGGVSMYDGGSFTHFTKKEGLSNNSVWSILEDKNENLWFGTNGGGVSMYNGESFTHFSEKEGLSNNTVWSILEDRYGNLWFGTNGGGVSMYNREFFIHFTEKEGLSNNYVRSISEDENGNIWFGTSRGGVSMYNGESFTHYTEKEGLSNNTVLSILEDKYGNLWFATWGGGVSIFHSKSFTYYTEKEGLSNKSVWSILEDKNGNIWFGTWGGGVSMFNGESFTHFTEKEGLSNNTVLSILEDKNENIWFGTAGGGVNMYNGESFIHYTEKEGLSNNYVRFILEDKYGNLWFGTKGGVSKYNGEYFTHFTEKEGLSGDDVLSILEDKNGNIWFGTWGGGVSMFNGESFTRFTEKEGLSSNYVRSILEDRNGNLWFGTVGGGISMYNGKSFTHYTEKEGLSSNVIDSILEDENGNIWFATRNGLCFIEKEKLDRNKNNDESIVFKVFVKKDGLKGIDFHDNCVCLDSKNRMWLANDKCLNMLDLNKYSPSKKPPLIYLKRLDINEQIIDYRNITDSMRLQIKFNGVKRFANYPLNLVLPHNQNHLTFHFAAIDWSAPHKIQYSYMMDGLNSKWSKPSQEAKADYRNIPYGSYTFKVRAIGESGEWSEASEYTFKINPPWWHTWWAHALYFILSALLILAFVRIRTAKLKKRQQQLETEVARATKEIIEQKEEIEKSHLETQQQKEIIEEAHKEITDSINYAERIQRSFLATEELLNTHLGDHFVYFKPKEAVSGDFYWAGELANGNFAVSCADSTGHGVPGAIMSILNISSIEKAVEQAKTNPAHIFNETRKLIIERLKKDGSPEGGKDGMDASLISLNPEKSKMTYVAAHNPIWIIRNEELIEIKAEKMPVGKHDLDQTPFEGGEIDLHKGDIIYTLTDGFQDQFGGEKGKKFKVKPMKQMLLDNAHLSMQEQLQKISDTFDSWKGNLEQVDDVCIVGVRV